MRIHANSSHSKQNAAVILLSLSMEGSSLASVPLSSQWFGSDCSPEVGEFCTANSSPADRP